jgi:DsbC/DsbD-like thiol-disulfide interchange protein
MLNRAILPSNNYLSANLCIPIHADFSSTSHADFSSHQHSSHAKEKIQAKVQTQPNQNTNSAKTSENLKKL